MAIEVKVPEVGESITEGTLARWLKRDGEAVTEGQPIFELETDKATGEIPAPASGTLKVQASEGTTVRIGAVVALIESSDGEPRKMAGTEKPAPPKDVPTEIRKPAAVPQTTEQAVAAGAKKPEPARQVEAKAVVPVQVSGLPGGNERENRRPMSRLRKTIAERLVVAQRTAAILTTFNEVDMGEILAIRAQYKERFKEQHGVNLGFMSFFIKAVVEGLKAFPVVNSRIEGEEIVEPKFYDIGVAVSTERGLMVPVIRAADSLQMAQLERLIEEFAAKAREGKIAVEDLQGGTFTITNGGVFGSLLSTPLLNPPQSAILGMHAIQKRPTVIGDAIEVRPMMYLALSYDHRLIDGRDAVLFLGRVKELIENPLQLVWGL
jgi:2-oxoglutarate dehydrogenase E2 component (dihydrolipoamide succinyltransferase)